MYTCTPKINTYRHVWDPHFQGLQWQRWRHRVFSITVLCNPRNHPLSSVVKLWHLSAFSAGTKNVNLIYSPTLPSALCFSYCYRAEGPDTWNWLHIFIDNSVIGLLKNRPILFWVADVLCLRDATNACFFISLAQLLTISFWLWILWSNLLLLQTDIIKLLIIRKLLHWQPSVYLLLHPSIAS